MQQVRLNVGPIRARWRASEAVLSSELHSRISRVCRVSLLECLLSWWWLTLHPSSPRASRDVLPWHTFTIECLEDCGDTGESAEYPTDAAQERTAYRVCS